MEKIERRYGPDVRIKSVLEIDNLWIFDVVKAETGMGLDEGTIPAVNRTGLEYSVSGLQM